MFSLSSVASFRRTSPPFFQGTQQAPWKHHARKLLFAESSPFEYLRFFVRYSLKFFEDVDLLFQSDSFTLLTDCESSFHFFSVTLSTPLGRLELSQEGQIGPFTRSVRPQLPRYVSPHPCPTSPLDLIGSRCLFFFLSKFPSLFCVGLLGLFVIYIFTPPCCCLSIRSSSSQSSAKVKNWTRQSPRDAFLWEASSHHPDYRGRTAGPSGARVS